MHPDTPADFSPRHPGSSRLRGKLALITGGTTGIGRAVAELFAREGARLIVTAHHDDDQAHDLIAELRQTGAEVHLAVLDVRDRAACHGTVEQMTARHGLLDVLVCNAAIQQVSADLATLSETDVSDAFATNVLGYLWMAQAAVPRMRDGGAIILTTSAVAYLGNAELVDYAATKGAGVALVRSLALQLGRRGIRVNGVAPGPVWTPLIAASLPPDDLETFGTDVPMGRPAQPNEIAPSFLFLASSDASYMTGQVLHPNGGMQVGS